jgi:hypothetical protein
MEYTDCLERINGTPGFDGYVRCWARKRMAGFFRVSEGDLREFKFNGTDNFVELGNVLKVSPEGAEKYYQMIIKITVENS